MDKETLMQQLWDQQGHTSPLALRPVRISGPDAQEFLQGQLTLDLRKLDASSHRLTAWCNAKGRVWCLVRIWREANDFVLLVADNQLEAFLKRLRMFVLRAKVVVEPQNETVLGWIGAAQQTVDVVVDEQGSHLRFDAHHGVTITHTLPALENPDLTHAWLALRLFADEPQINADTQEQFLPQSLGLDALDGLHFNKGCFVGQEIVARVHYRGRAPQRTRTLLNPSDEELANGVVLASIHTCQQRVVQLVEHV